MSDHDKLYQLRGQVGLAHWTLAGTDHQAADAIYRLVGHWDDMTCDQAESALNCYRDALDKHAADVL